MPRLHPEKCFCPFCGAKPGRPCRTSGGLTAQDPHSIRVIASSHGRNEGNPSTNDIDKATRYECWCAGWESGTSNTPEIAAVEVAGMLLAPKDFRKGYERGLKLYNREIEKGRKIYYIGDKPNEF